MCYQSTTQNMSSVNVIKDILSCKNFRFYKMLQLFQESAFFFVCIQNFYFQLNRHSGDFLTFVDFIVKENFAIIANTKQILPFLLTNRLLARSTFQIRVLTYGTIFQLKSNHHILMKYSKHVSTMQTPNSDSLFHVIVSIALICL